MKAPNRRAELLISKLSAIRSELEASKEIIDIANSELQRLYDKRSKGKEQFKPEDAQQNPLANSQASVQDPLEAIPAEKLADPEVKKMFKKIASVCHPDKIQDLRQDSNKKRLETLYQRARQALDDNDFYELFSIYKELDINLPDLSPQQIVLIQNKINTIKKELNNIESSIAWGWYFEEDENKKQKIQEKIFELLDTKNKHNSRP